MILIYRVISILILPLLFLLFIIRAISKKENFLSFKQKFGIYSIKRPQGEIFWIHAVSVGEAISSFSLVDELLANSDKINILITTTTLTSAEIVSKKISSYNNKVIHQFLPVDSLIIVNKFLKYWKPKIAVFIESEIWPNFIYQSKKMGILTFLVNARISERSYKRWDLIKSIFGINLFDNFSLIYAQSREDKIRINNLTKREVLCYGNLKSQSGTLSYNQNDLLLLKEMIKKRKIWLASSTHKGEEEIIISAHKKIKLYFPDILTIIVPRHPSRAHDIISLLRGVNYSQRSLLQEISPLTEIYLADTMSELGLFYELCDLAFIGGSLVKVGGHNPFEPIKLKCAVISGNNTFNFSDIYQKLHINKCCKLVENEEDLVRAVIDLIEDETLLDDMISRSIEIIKQELFIAKNIAKRLIEISSIK